LLNATAPDRQTLLFSATLDGAVDGLVRRYQRSPRRHAVEAERSQAGEVRHLFWSTDVPGRVPLTAEVVARHRSTIVFSRTKHGADRLVKQLATAGVRAVAIHGNRSQPQRERALQQFTSGRVQALVATDVAARGIHVDDVGCVVHFDPPADEKDYVHRSGRTGRAGSDGVVVSLVLPDKQRAVRLLQRALGVEQRISAPDLVSLGDAVAAVPVVAEVPQPAPAIAVARPPTLRSRNQNRDRNRRARRAQQQRKRQRRTVSR
jgi:superfamily II DNA/RNA helicase